jgi:hypothetical protein
MALWRNRLALVKAEGSYGVSSSPAATDALLFTELDIEPLALELVERETIQSYLGNRASVVAQRSVPVKGTVELAGSGTAGTAPRWGAMLKACGLSETVVASTSVTYTPVSSSFSSCTMDFYADNGSRQAITGIRGTAELNLEAGSIPTLAFDHMGIYAAPGALSRPTETYSAQASPLVVNADNTTVSVHGMSACMSSFSLSLGVEMVFRQLAGCSKQVLITDRKPSGSITIELPAFATKDFLAIASAQTAGAITWTHTGPAGNIVTFTASNCAFDGPTLDESDGITNITLPFRPLPTAAGNDEFSIALT